jgi:hypothetical protein
MQEEMFLALFKVLSRHMPRGTEKNHDHPVRIASVPVEIQPDTSRIEVRDGTA